MQNTVRTLLACALTFGFSQGAAAQNTGWGDRAYINIGFGVEDGKTDFADSKPFAIYDETATINSTSSFTSGGLLDVGVGVRIWRNLSVGAAYHQEANTSSTTLSGTVPHPIFFNSSRNVSLKVDGEERTESAQHMVLGWTMPFGSKLDVTLFAGPSWFRLQQDVAALQTDAAGTPRLSEAAPFTKVILNATKETRKKSVMGYNAGFDVAYMAWQNDSVRLGVGGFLRYTSATAKILMLTKELETTVGGIQFGFGGRVRF